MHANPRVNWPLRIGTMGSPLAARQAEEVRARLVATHALPATAFEIVALETRGDKAVDGDRRQGLFTFELEERLWCNMTQTRSDGARESGRRSGGFVAGDASFGPQIPDLPGI
ncbi:hypothetical protein [Rhizobium tibeticum]|nr:hypothetical protein [Rhizobium tibeticum]